MKKGDLVKYHWPSYLGASRTSAEHNEGIGIVIDVIPWTDIGAPDRNFGIHVHVYWTENCEINIYDEDELEIIHYAS